MGVGGGRGLRQPRIAWNSKEGSFSERWERPPGRQRQIRWPWAGGERGRPEPASCPGRQQGSLLPDRWGGGGDPPGDTEGVGTARLQTVLSSAWGQPGPSHAPPGMRGCSWELSRSVTYPLESEVSQPPRPGPAFLTGSQHKQGARGGGQLRAPQPPPSDRSPLSFLSGRSCLMPEVPRWGRGRQYQGSALWETLCRSPAPAAVSERGAGRF